MSLKIAYFVRDENVTIDNIRSSPRLPIAEYDKKEHKGKVYCPLGHKLMGKKGEKVTWHYSHLRDYGDDCCRHMGEWHHWWQDRVMDDFLEIIITKSVEKDKNKTHIADMINGNDMVIEFQKSVIPEKVIQAREKFYNKMIWVFGCEQHDFEVVQIISKFVLIKLVSGSTYFTIAKKQSFLDMGKRHLLEMLEVNKKKKSNILIYCKIWTLKEFDRQFMNGCLKENYEDRHNAHGFEFVDDGRDFEICKKIFES